MEPSPLVYDTAAAAAVWQRVGPALPAYDAAPCPAGACCPLPRRETDSEAMLGGLIAEGAALYACCRRCAVRAPRQSRQALEQLAREEQRAVRALLPETSGKVKLRLEAQLALWDKARAIIESKEDKRV